MYLMRIAGIASATLMLTTPAFAVSAPAPDFSKLKPHRAVYDLRLDDVSLDSDLLALQAGEPALA